MTKPIPVVCAIIFYKDKVLACQRSKTMDLPLHWEFPGGKVKPNETKEAALVREIKEELNLAISMLKPMGSHTFAYPQKTIQLVAFTCEVDHPHQLKCLEHKAAKWLFVQELSALNWAPADVVFVKMLEARIK